ncbi:DUF5347 family protein [Providencia stuartii]|uniref:DUF5347 family protein n=1 Tax=Providencia stuartii TaxID=588 RepID=UPI0028C2F6DB|nr:DUF5347 family protein [Providencia stuartii]MDT7048728.1 DUF5347 family protein [Providencia stuartii]
MASTITELAKTEGIIQLLNNVEQDVSKHDCVSNKAIIKAYKNDGGSIAERTYAINKAAALRTSVFHKNKENPKNHELAGFIEYLRLNDKRTLSMIFYLAEIKKEQHNLKFYDFSKEEKQSIITAINKIKALAALIPKNIAMPI